MNLFRSIAAATFALSVAAPAQALTFSFTTVGGDTLSSDQAAAFNTAAAAWSSVFTDNFTVNLKIGFRSLSAGVLGQTSASFLSGSTTAVRGLLAADAKSADDATAVASLSNLPANGTIIVTSAQAKALGQTYTGDDGTIEFSSNYNFSTARDSNGNIAAGTYDLVGIAEHEIGHVLAFDSSIDGSFGFPTLLDEFRYASSGTRSLSAGATAYFSIDGGVTNLANFAIGGNGNDQASHWLRGTTSDGANALMDPAIAVGQTQNITPLERVAFDVAGYDLATNVPEPATIALLLPFALAAVQARRRG